jgi:hypothetical protein
MPRIFWAALVASLGWLAAACGDGDDRGGGEDTGADVDTDADGDTDADSDPDAGADCDPAWGWYDVATGLCWENPPSGIALSSWDEAEPYCDGLSIGGFDDWRLPLIQELISLIRGCVDGVATGDLGPSGCGADDPGCLEESCSDASCAACDDLAGPGGYPSCFWDPELGSDCCSYWSASVSATDAEDAWYVFFQQGTADVGVKSFDGGYARCVRGGS